MHRNSPDSAGGHKRPRDDSDYHSGDETWKPKRRAVQPQLRYRVLCPLQRCGGVLGKGGETMKRVRRETGCRIRVEEVVRNSDERVVTIGEIESGSGLLSSPEDALLQIHDLILSAGPPRAQQDAVARLLIDKASTGSILGKGGSIISDMRRSSGAIIRLISGGSAVPPCAEPGDELLEMVGSPEEVRRALVMVTAQLRTRSSRKPQGQVFNIKADATAGSFRLTAPDALAVSNAAGVPASSPGLPPGFGGGLRIAAPPPPPVPCPLQASPSCGEVVFRLLVPTACIGMVLGRNGDIVKQIRSETGARVKVGGDSSGDPERVVTISSADEPGSNNCPAAQALLRCCAHILPTERAQARHTVRLLIPSWQVAPLMGPNDSAANELRDGTGAELRVVSSGRKSASPGEEVAQISGTHETCLNAVARVAASLHEAQRHGRAPDLREEETPTSRVDYRPPHFAKRQEHPGRPPRPEYDSDPGSLSRGPPLMRGSPSYRGLPPRTSGFSDDRRPEPRRLAMLRRDGRDSHDSSPRSIDSRGSGGFERPNMGGGGGPSSCIMLLLSKKQAGCILGKAGAHINQIRQISGARVKLFESPLPNGDRRMEIIGMKGQTASAQNLIQGFLLAADLPPLRDTSGSRHSSRY